MHGIGHGSLTVTGFSFLLLIQICKDSFFFRANMLVYAHFSLCRLYMISAKHFYWSSSFSISKLSNHLCGGWGWRDVGPLRLVWYCVWPFPLDANIYPGFLDIWPACLKLLPFDWLSGHQILTLFQQGMPNVLSWTVLFYFCPSRHPATRYFCSAWLWHPLWQTLLLSLMSFRPMIGAWSNKTTQYSTGV